MSTQQRENLEAILRQNAYHAILDEPAAALDRAGQLLAAHLAGAERVTA